MKEEIDSIVRQIEHEYVTYPEYGDQLTNLLHTLEMKGPGRVDALKDALRSYVIDMNVPIELRQYADAQLTSIVIH